ncbi:DUF4367 domain-containing protein [Paenibacillus sediminis]|uniref:Transcriptional regulator n=1 Tax=Paenibacillus sediminis TaxID=664909 RepID=A0ABS4H0K4_9BACL|nr:DUF4367 domain-containing protein [Paenibacillus sediminis]MBP1935991.1 transcriptional regulator [Paenibacillus sediminis]
MKNEKYDELFDKLFDESFEQALSVSYLTSEDAKKSSWLKVQRQIESMNRRKNRLRGIRMISVVAASVLIGAVLFSPPVVTKALSPFYQGVQSFGDGMVSVIFGNQNNALSKEDAKTPPPPEAVEDPNKPSATMIKEGNSSFETVPFSEAQSKVSFTLPGLSYIPAKFQIDHVELLFESNKTLSSQATLFYKSSDGNQFRVIFDQIELNEVQTSSGTNHTEEIELSKDSKAYLTIDGSKFSSIQFMVNDIHVKIFGQLSRDELIEIAKKTK